MAEKKRVKVEAKAPRKSGVSEATGELWEASPEAKSKALKLRIAAFVLWAIAIGLEIFTIIWALAGDKTFDTTKMWWVIGLVVVIGIFAITGSLLWKKANRLDPASEKNKFRFFVQNQLGAIMAVLAFLPLIIFVLADSNLSGKQKGIVGGIAAVIFAAVFAGSIDYDNPSREKYTEDDNIVTLLYGNSNTDQLAWTKSGKVYHLCDKVPDVNKSSADNQVYTGTVAAAQEAGKARLTKNWRSEAKQCGFTEADIMRAERGLQAAPSTLLNQQQLDDLDKGGNGVPVEPGASTVVPHSTAVPVPSK